MDDNNVQVYSDEEYEEALEKLSKSKSSREKKVVKEQKQRKKSERRNSKSEDSGLSFIERCKKDKIIPISILAILLVIVGLGLYILIPKVYTKTIHLTVDELRNNYSQTTIYNEALLGYNFEIPEVKYIIRNQDTASKSEESPEFTDQKITSDSFNYFNTAIPNTATAFATGIQGSTRKVDNEIVNLRVLIEYTKDESFFGFMNLYFASYLQTICPDMSKDEAIEAITASIGNLDGAESPFTIKGDIAYRTSIGTDDKISYVALDIIPASNVK